MPKFKVTVEWTTTDACDQEFEVEAATAEEACETAERLADATSSGWSKSQIVDGWRGAVDVREVKP